MVTGALRGIFKPNEVIRHESLNHISRTTLQV